MEGDLLKPELSGKNIATIFTLAKEGINVSINGERFYSKPLKTGYLNELYKNLKTKDKLSLDELKQLAARPDNLSKRWFSYVFSIDLIESAYHMYDDKESFIKNAGFMPILLEVNKKHVQLLLATSIYFGIKGLFYSMKKAPKNKYELLYSSLPSINNTFSKSSEMQSFLNKDGGIFTLEYLTPDAKQNPSKIGEKITSKSLNYAPYAIGEKFIEVEQIEDLESLNIKKLYHDVDAAFELRWKRSTTNLFKIVWQLVVRKSSLSEDSIGSSQENKLYEMNVSKKKKKKGSGVWYLKEYTSKKRRDTEWLATLHAVSKGIPTTNFGMKVEKPDFAFVEKSDMTNLLELIPTLNDSERKNIMEKSVDWLVDTIFAFYDFKHIEKLHSNNYSKNKASFKKQVKLNVIQRYKKLLNLNLKDDFIECCSPLIEKISLLKPGIEKDYSLKNLLGDKDGNLLVSDWDMIRNSPYIFGLARLLCPGKAAMHDRKWGKDKISETESCLLRFYKKFDDKALSFSSKIAPFSDNFQVLCNNYFFSEFYHSITYGSNFIKWYFNPDCKPEEKLINRIYAISSCKQAKSNFDNNILTNPDIGTEDKQKLDRLVNHYLNDLIKNRIKEKLK